MLLITLEILVSYTQHFFSLTNAHPLPLCQKSSMTMRAMRTQFHAFFCFYRSFCICACAVKFYFFTYLHTQTRTFFNEILLKTYLTRAYVMVPLARPHSICQRHMPVFISCDISFRVILLQLCIFKYLHMCMSHIL